MSFRPFIVLSVGLVVVACGGEDPAIIESGGVKVIENAEAQALTRVMPPRFGGASALLGLALLVARRGRRRS